MLFFTNMIVICYFVILFHYIYLYLLLFLTVAISVLIALASTITITSHHYYRLCYRFFFSSHLLYIVFIQ